MFVQKNFSLIDLIKFTGWHIIWLTAWASLVCFIYKYFDLYWLSIPWLPVSVIGTAVAFYVGFKNNQAYDRLWEARKIWGAIINSSRIWGSTINNFISNQFSEQVSSDEELHDIKKKMIYRHIGWLYILRKQLLVPTPWEHISQGKHIAKVTRKRMSFYGADSFNDQIITLDGIKEFLGNEECNELGKSKNIATQLINKQSKELVKLREMGLIEDFRHMELQKILNDFYIHQGKCERIKKFPLPRQYAGVSPIFIGIFIFLLPFGIISEFDKLGDYVYWLSIPFTVLISWVYLMMELVGDYSENPFEGLGNDIPMLSICRTIEIDLKEMLGETDLPPSIQSKNGVLQ